MLSTIFNLFEVGEEIRLIDNFKSYEKEFTAKAEKAKIKNFSSSEYTELNEGMIGLGYDWTFEIAEINFLVSQTEFKAIDLNDIEEGEELTINVKVFKKGKNIHVFDEDKFFEFINSESLESHLNFLKTRKEEGIVFYNTQSQYKNSNNFLGYNKILKAGENDNTIISSQCNFNNYSNFKFTPSDFHLLDNPDSNAILQLFNKLHFVFLLIYLLDNTEIENNFLKTKLSGYKTYRHEVSFNNLDISSIDVYKNIYKWAYSEPNKIEDKIGITRNILSMYFSENDLNIDMDSFSSILSANETYIKGNISKYMEVRGKIHNQLEQLSERVNKALETFYSNFQKTIFVFISYYISIFLIRTYAKVDVEKIFTKQLTYMGLALLGLSFVFMIFSNLILNLEKKRIKTKYEDVKERAKDILVIQDIEKLLKGDKEYNSELEFLNKRRQLYITLWVLTIAVFLTVLAYTSDHI